MGQRANLVVVENGAWTLHYDHWCANRLDVELFWGPALAVAYFRQCEPLADRSDWLDVTWCEGGAVIDLDKRVLLFFGGEDILYDVPLRHTFLDLMARSWQGWEIRWADEGIVSIGRYLVVPKETFLDDSDPESGFLLNTDYPEDNLTLVTQVDEHGTCSAWRLCGSDDCLEVGPAGLAILDETPGEKHLAWAGSQQPHGGIHLDMVGRTLSFWWASPAPDILDRVQRAWPGWKVHWLKDRYEDHLRLVGDCVRLDTPAVETLRGRVIDYLRRNCHHEASNPARKLAPRLGAKNVEISPWTDAGRGSTGAAADKLAILDALESSLGQPPDRP